MTAESVQTLRQSVFAALAGLFFVFAEISLMTFFRTITVLTVSFLACFFISVFMIFSAKSYRLCSVFVLSSGICSLILALTVFFADMTEGIENNTFYEVAVNWIAPNFCCVFVRLFDRKRRIEGFDRFFRISSTLFFVIYLLGLLALLFFGSANRGYEYRSVNLIPFETIRLFWNAETLSTEVKWLNLAGNVLVFVPLGFYLAVWSRKIKIPFSILILLIVPVVVEVLQYVFKVGASDIDDVILNFAGGLLGMLLCFLIEGIYRLFHHAKGERLFDFHRSNSR